MNLKNIFSAILVASLLFTATAADFMAPSTTNPGGFSNSEVPQLIVIGSDDNTDAEALRWMVAELASRTNKDGSAMRASFYSNTRTWASDEELVNAHKEAYAAKHEIGNHTVEHISCIEWHTLTDSVTGEPYDSLGKVWTASELANEQIIPVKNALLSLVGIDANDLYGFRTPYLQYSNNTFDAMVDAGIVYDCSIGEGGQTSDKPGGVAGNYFWPYTLDTKNSDNNNYAPGLPNWWTGTKNSGNVVIGQHSGLWELPAYNYKGPADVEEYMDSKKTWATGGEIGGLDYNMWAPLNSGGWELNKDQSIRTLKNTLDLMYAGNRTPMTIGAHSQMYFGTNSQFPNITSEADRKAVFTEFLDYAKNFDNVWFVTGAQAINYCKSPVKTSAFNPDDYLPENFNNTGTKYTLTVENGVGGGDYVEGAIKTISANAAPTGKVFDKWTGDVSSIADVNSAITTITIGTAAITVTATYKDKPVEDTTGIIFDDFANAYGDGNDQTYLGAAYGTALYSQDSCYMGGGYMYVYSDDSGSIITAGDGTTEITGDNADAMVENGVLHAHIKTASSTEEYPYATIEVPILDSGSAYHDFSNMTALVITAKGSGKVRVAFNTKDVADLGQGWGFYGAELTLGGSDSTYVISTSNLTPEEGSNADTSGWDWNHGSSEVKYFTISSVSGDAEVYVNSIKFRGMAYSDLFTGYVEPTPVSISMNSVKNRLPVSLTTKVSGATTMLKYNVAVPGKVDVKIFDLRGKMVANFSDNRGVGIFQKNLNLSSGIYSIRVKTSEGILNSRFTVAK